MGQKEIDKLRLEVIRLENETEKAKEALHDAMVASSGFGIGQVVEARRNYGKQREWRRAIIRHIHTSYYRDSLRFVVSFAKKNGDWSQVTTDYAEVRKPE